MLSIIAGFSAALAMAFLGLRAQMLKPDMASWPDAPRCVRWASFVLSAAMGSYVVAIVNGYPASTGEAAIFPLIAGYSGLLTINLYRQIKP